MENLWQNTFESKVSYTSPAEIDLSMNLLKTQSLYNDSFIAAPFMLLYAAKLCGKYQKQKEHDAMVMERMWSGVYDEELTETSYFMVPFMGTPSIFAPWCQIDYRRWEFYRNETRQNGRSSGEYLENSASYMAHRSNGHVNISQYLKAEDIEKDVSFFITYAGFVGTWKNHFNPSETFTGPFYSSAISKKDVNYMTLPGPQLWKYSENEHFQVLSLPYEPTQFLFTSKIPFSLNIFIPKTRFGLDEALQKLDATTYEALLSNATDTYVTGAIPKFRIEKPFDAHTYYKSFGLGQLVNNDTLSGTVEADMEAEREKWDKHFRATRDRVSENKPGWKHLHLPSFEIDENGTNSKYITVAASTKSDILKSTISKKFIADHPFVFVLSTGRRPLLVGVFK